MSKRLCTQCRKFEATVACGKCDELVFCTKGCSSGLHWMSCAPSKKTPIKDDKSAKFWADKGPAEKEEKERGEEEEEEEDEAGAPAARNPLFWQPTPAQEQAAATGSTLPTPPVKKEVHMRTAFATNMWLYNSRSEMNPQAFPEIVTRVVGMVQWPDAHPTFGGQPYQLDEYDRSIINPQEARNQRICKDMEAGRLFVPLAAFELDPTTIMLRLVADVLFETTKIISGRWVVTQPQDVPDVIHATVGQRRKHGGRESRSLLAVLLALDPSLSADDDVREIETALSVLQASSGEEVILGMNDCYRAARTMCCQTPKKSKGLAGYTTGVYAVRFEHLPAIGISGSESVLVDPSALEFPLYRDAVHGVKILGTARGSDEAYEVLLPLLREELNRPISMTPANMRETHIRLQAFYRHDVAMAFFSQRDESYVSAKAAKFAEEDLASHGKAITRTNVQAVVQNVLWVYEYPDVRDQINIQRLSDFGFVFDQAWYDYEYAKTRVPTKPQVERAVAYFKSQGLTITPQTVRTVIMSGAKLQFSDEDAITHMAHLVRAGKSTQQ